MEKLEEREELFREVVETSCDITLVTDGEFKIRYISSSVTDLFGQEPMALLGRTIFDFVSKKKAGTWRTCLAELKDTTHSDISLTVPVNREKRFFTAQVTNLLTDTNVRGVIVKLHDVTETKNREQELIESNLHLDQVFYKTTHDLKAPLRSVLGLVNLAEEATDEERKQYIALIKKSLLKLDGLIEEMNDFFKGERLEIKREKIDLKRLISEEIDNLRNLREMERIKVEVDIDQHIDFYSDLLRVRTIITNLITNAIKYSDLTKRWPFIRIEAVVKSQQCDIKVQDNGIGIEPQYRHKIFDRFFRATTHAQGTGLGLFIVKDTVQRLSGTIEVSSPKEVGTTFGVAIPNQTHRTVL
jgi:PAS domain S-box-containing protein